MKMCERSKSFLRDVSVNLIGVIVAAVISIFIAFHVYDCRSQEQCNSILEMVIEENSLNETNSGIILNFLTPIVEDNKKDLLSMNNFMNRFLTKATNIASESNLVLSFTSPALRKDILVHSTNLHNLNANIDEFNNFITRSKTSSLINFSYVKQWAAQLIETINERSDNSKEISKKIRIYLNNQ